MEDLNTRRRRFTGRRGLLWPALIASAASVALAACGSATSGNPNQLLKQTFSGTHKVNSGSLSLVLTVRPTGSSTIKNPIRISLGGPFESQGSGKLPKSDFTLSLSGNGASNSIAVLSTGTAGYVTLQGTSYQLPQSTFQKLESSFAQVASGSGGGSGSGTLSKLGIQPLDWLRNPTIVGTENVGGADTTHVRAGVNVAAFVNDLSTFLQKASSVGVSGASRLSGGLSASTRNQIANAVRNPSFDVWTGSDDKTMRKLEIGLTVPVTGQLSAAFGGLSSAAIGLTLQYANLNQPQTITAPSAVRPYSEFSGKLRSLAQTLQGGVGSLSGAGGSTSSGSGTAAGVQSYSKCIQAAGNDVSKMQQCASLLSGK